MWDTAIQAWIVNDNDPGARAYAEDAKRLQDLVAAANPPADWN